MPHYIYSEFMYHPFSFVFSFLFSRITLHCGGNFRDTHSSITSIGSLLASYRLPNLPSRRKLASILRLIRFSFSAILSSRVLGDVMLRRNSAQSVQPGTANSE